MARPRKVSPETVSAAVDGMIKAYQDTGSVDALTDYELMQRLDISSRTLDRYYSGDADDALLQDDNITDTERDKYKKYGYGAAVKKLIEFRRAVCVQHIATDRFNTGWIFLSKQPRYGGFQDVQRVEKSGNQVFTVCIQGPDGQPIKE